MRTTLDINVELLQRARKLSRITGKTALVHAGLEALIAREARARLARLGGTEKKATAPKRRRGATDR
ncbi:MAG: antitoxin [Deltaproteobacteria bacterium RIFOXYA12_FULL_58_15]|nr:MAG: antitoxin [Deltaproteobacteria bacterium RIFOXYA12_FULL_58_15]OGR08976.1 MAG: antitoxin [Deltaproteobacteria bacterium RIFOXYB12_FULL_58_9]